MLGVIAIVCHKINWHFSYESFGRYICESGASCHNGGWLSRFHLDDGVMVLKSGDYWGYLFRLRELFVIF